MKGTVFNMKLPIKVQGVMYSRNNEKLEYLIIKRSANDGGFWQGMGNTIFDCTKIMKKRNIHMM